MPAEQDVALSWEIITEDAVLCQEPCWFYGIVCTSTITEVTAVYDGVNASGKGPLNISTVAAASRTERLIPPEPLYFHAGLFVDIPAATTSALVMWRPARQGDRPSPPPVSP